LQPVRAIAIYVKIYVCISVPYVVRVWYFSNTPTFDCHSIVV